MSKMTDKMSEASAGSTATLDRGVGLPRKGDHFRCQKCGMEIQVTTECHCPDPDRVHFHCCGQELERL